MLGFPGHSNVIGNEMVDTLAKDAEINVDRQVLTWIIPCTDLTGIIVCHWKRMAKILAISQPSGKCAKGNKTRNWSLHSTGTGEG